MITYPNAKINLGLNIVEKRPDGYHNLETIFYPINLQDALEVTELENEEGEYKLKVSGVPIEGDAEKLHFIVSSDEVIVIKRHNAF